MKVGDLIRYKDKDIEGYGVVLEAPIDDDMVLFYFIDHYPDYIWDYTDILEVVIVLPQFENLIQIAQVDLEVTLDAADYLAGIGLYIGLKDAEINAVREERQNDQEDQAQRQEVQDELDPDRSQPEGPPGAEQAQRALGAHFISQGFLVARSRSKFD